MEPKLIVDQSWQAAIMYKKHLHNFVKLCIMLQIIYIFII